MTYFQALETSSRGTLGQQDTIQVVDKDWTQDYLKEEQQMNDLDVSDGETKIKTVEEMLQENSKRKKENVYDIPDSGDSLENLPVDLFSQNAQEQKIIHQKCFSPFSSPELSYRLVRTD